MKKIVTRKGNPYVIPAVEAVMPQFDKADYEMRIALLLRRMADRQLTHAVVYADREHFANMDYLTGYEPRFEEALFIVSATGELTLVIGNEGWGYSFACPLDVNRVLYQNFSLQGQPRERLLPLQNILRGAGIGEGAAVGVIGHKYFAPEHMDDPQHRVDIPAYIMEDIIGLAGRKQVVNATDIMTNMTDGLRIIIRSAKEIAFYEYTANKASNGIIRFLQSLKPGVAELEASKLIGYDATPISMFPIVNFGEEHVKLGLRSPDYRELVEGDMVTVCWGLRGALVARSGLAAFNGLSLAEGLSDAIEQFYKPYFAAIASWYESLAIGANCGDIFDRVMDIIGDWDRFGVYLNPGHNISGDEWANAPFFQGSPYGLQSGYYLQCDIIASNDAPFKMAILEDGIMLADEKLRRQLQDEYPDVFARIMKRKAMMKEQLGIVLSEDALPLSNCQGVLHPYMLNHRVFFAVEA